jgi:F-type H+-transporting ATPase subunit delta
MIQGIVNTAFPLTPEEMTRLEGCMTGLLGAPVTLTERVDKALLAGISVEIAGRVMDNSLKGRLALVQRELMKRGSILDA